jgi:hypothetical protein
MNLVRILTVAAATLVVTAPFTARTASPPPVRITYQSMNAGEIDPCG